MGLSSKITRKLSSDFLTMAVVYINQDVSNGTHRVIYNNIEDLLWERLRSKIGFALSNKIRKDLEAMNEKD